MKGKNRTVMLKNKEERRVRDKKGSKLSKYARKAAYLAKTGLWGFEVPFPKPWKTKN